MISRQLTAFIIVVALSVTAATHATIPNRPTIGFAINLHHTDQLDLYIQSIDQMAAMGIDSLQIVTPAFQNDGASSEIRIEVGKGRGPSRAMLDRLLTHAHNRGLTTCLMPTVLFTQPRGNEWRGKIQPETWAPWWQSYRTMLDYFLAVAADNNVERLVIGSELLTTERQTAQWQALISHAREQFKGQLTYSTNWDHFTVPTFWQQLDMIGISGYWDLTRSTGSDNPTDTQLDKRWASIREKIIAFGNAQGKPILLTEVGYPALPWALKHPWNYLNKDNRKPDGRAQARGYASFLRAWSRALRSDTSPMAGVFFYAWSPYHHGGNNDTGYGIRGKPAFNLLQKWLHTTRSPTNQ